MSGSCVKKDLSIKPFIGFIFFLLLLSTCLGGDREDSILSLRHYEPRDAAFRLGCNYLSEIRIREELTNVTALSCRAQQCLVGQKGLQDVPIGLAREVLYFTMPRDEGDTTLSIRQPLHIGRNEVTYLGGTFITTQVLPYSAFGQNTDSLTYWWRSSNPWVPDMAFPRLDIDSPASSRAAFVPEVARIGFSFQWGFP